jgi:hypothetical protein
VIAMHSTYTDTCDQTKSWCTFWLADFPRIPKLIGNTKISVLDHRSGSDINFGVDRDLYLINFEAKSNF